MVGLKHTSKGPYSSREQQVNAVECHAQDKDTVLCEEVTGWMAYLLRHGTKQMTDAYDSSSW